LWGWIQVSKSSCPQSSLAFLLRMEFGRYKILIESM
jgi:hypothetical protein